MKHKWMAGIAMSGFLFSQLGIQHSAAANDTTVPIFKSISVNKKTLGTGDTLKVSVDAEDVDSGIDTIVVDYFFGNDDREIIELHYNEETKKYEGSSPVNGKDFWENTTWKVYQILLTDKSGNQLMVYNTGVRQWPGSYTPKTVDLSAATINIEGNDTTPPVLNGLHVDKTNVSNGDKLTFIVDAEDADTGIDYGKIELENTEYHNASLNFPLTYNVETKKLETTVDVDKEFTGGHWKVRRISLFDKNKSAAHIYNKETDAYYNDAQDLSAGNFYVKDTLPPVISGFKDGEVYTDNVTVEFNEGRALINGNTEWSGHVVTKDGKYTVVVTDDFGNVSTASFTIDRVAPIISGVEQGKAYKTSVTPTFNEGEATLNGKSFSSGSTITEEGDYTLIVTDKAKHETKRSFSIDKTKPVVSGVKPNGFYRNPVSVLFNEGEGYMSYYSSDKNQWMSTDFKSGDTFTDSGDYFLHVYDKANNETEFMFRIINGYPLITGIEDGGFYFNATISFTEGIATLNGKPFASGTNVSEEGTHTFVLTEDNGTVHSITFTVDNTPPSVKGVESGFSYRQDITPTFNEGTATLNGKEFKNGETIHEEGSYELIVKDKADNTTKVNFTIDRTGPDAPTVDEVNQSSTRVIGKTEPEATVKIKLKDKEIGTWYSGEDGRYSVDIPKQPAGTKLSVVSIDKAGNVGTPKEFIVVDKEKPVFYGSEADDFPLNQAFNPRTGITAKDNVDGDVTKNITIEGNVNTAVKGEYYLTYKVSDKAGNIAIFKRYIVVRDVKAPVFSGIENKTIFINSTFDPKSGVTAKDDGDGDVTKDITISGSVNAKIKGNYTLTYSVKDSSGNQSVIKRIITVQAPDTTKPVISGATDKTVTINTPFDSKAGVTAKDNLDGDLTKALSVTGNVNTKVKGVYTLTYTVKDKAGNTATLTRKITVADNVKPVISGANDKTITINTKFDSKAGITAKDNLDGDVTKLITVKGTVNTKVKGVYSLTYTVKDKAGNTANVVRKITVADNVKPVISGASNKSVPLNSKFDSRAGVTAKDNVDGDVTKLISVKGTVNTKVKGIYTLTYSVKDKAGNVTTITRKITVIDNVKPVISGASNKTIKLNSSFNSRTGVTAKDNVDGDITKSMTVTGNVNTKKKGTYSLTYTSVDKSGNKTVVIRKISVS
ncbi:hypothetical protein CN918_30685 [Priestia megaterium]|nr:hypothetical protein CN918_30685 [Priestia megaterium]